MLLRVREQLSDISQLCRTQQRVHQGMQQHIRIGMSQKSPVIGNSHPAKNQRSSLHQPVNVISVSDP